MLAVTDIENQRRGSEVGSLVDEGLRTNPKDLSQYDGAPERGVRLPAECGDCQETEGREIAV